MIQLKFDIFLFKKWYRSTKKMTRRTKVYLSLNRCILPFIMIHERKLICIKCLTTQISLDLWKVHPFVQWLFYLSYIWHPPRLSWERNTGRIMHDLSLLWTSQFLSIDAIIRSSLTSFWLVWCRSACASLDVAISQILTGRSIWHWPLSFVDRRRPLICKICTINNLYFYNYTQLYFLK